MIPVSHGVGHKKYLCVKNVSIRILPNWKLIPFITAAVLVVWWISLTLWVEREGPKKSWELGNKAATKKVLIVYDPDPFYNLDEQICRSFGEAFNGDKFHVVITSVKGASDFLHLPFSLYVFCANTYNWRPDRAISTFLTKSVDLNGKDVVAITVGAGSTEASQRAFEKLILQQNAHLLGSRSFWVLKPNNELKPEIPNAQNATLMASEWGKQLAFELEPSTQKFSNSVYERWRE
jgi:hypothetical protein